MKILSKFWEQMERDGRLGEEKRIAHSFVLRSLLSCISFCITQGRLSPISIISTALLLNHWNLRLTFCPLPCLIKCSGDNLHGDSGPRHFPSCNTGISNRRPPRLPCHAREKRKWVSLQRRTYHFYLPSIGLALGTRGLECSLAIYPGRRKETGLLVSTNVLCHGMLPQKGKRPSSCLMRLPPKNHLSSVLSALRVRLWENNCIWSKSPQP